MNRKRQAIDIARMLADVAAFEKSRSVAASTLSLADEEARLATLEQYLDEYRTHAADRGSRISSSLIRSRHEFVDSLARAVRDQGTRVQNLRSRVDRDVSEWRNARARVGAFDEYLDRRAERDNARRGRREQARLDEVSRRRPP